MRPEPRLGPGRRGYVIWPRIQSGYRPYLDVNTANVDYKITEAQNMNHFIATGQLEEVDSVGNIRLLKPKRTLPHFFVPNAVSARP